MMLEKRRSNSKTERSVRAYTPIFTGELGNSSVADVKTMVSILRANLPDAIEITVSQGERSRKNTPTEEKDSRQPSQETPNVRSGHLRRSHIPQPLLPSGTEISVNLSPNPHTAIPSPSQYIQQELPIHPSFEHTASQSPQDLKRKRPYVEAGPSSSTSPTSIPYYSPAFVDTQPFLPETYDNIQGLQQPGVPNTGQPGTEPFTDNVEIYGYPYYFDN